MRPSEGNIKRISSASAGIIGQKHFVENTFSPSLGRDMRLQARHICSRMIKAGSVVRVSVRLY